MVQIVKRQGCYNDVKKIMERGQNDVNCSNGTLMVGKKILIYNKKYNLY